MRNRSLTTAFVFSMALVFLMVSVASAEGIKSRLKERKPVIEALKNQEVIGENNKGQLEFMGSSRDKEAIVSAENSDRQEIYHTIAKQQGTSADIVGSRRAMQIRKKGKPGQWFQDSNGKWNRK